MLLYNPLFLEKSKCFVTVSWIFIGLCQELLYSRVIHACTYIADWEESAYLREVDWQNEQFILYLCPDTIQEWGRDVVFLLAWTPVVITTHGDARESE